MWLKGCLTLAAFFVMAKNESRAEREAAIVDLNAIAGDFDIEPIAKRSNQSIIEAFFKKLCSAVSVDQVEQVMAAREKYVNAGGNANLPTECLEKLQRGSGEVEPDVEGQVPSHRKLVQSLYSATMHGLTCMDINRTKLT